MSALYIMRYLGSTGTGYGSIYIGKGVILGVDATNGRYRGTYTETAGRLKATVIMTPSEGAVLVTGEATPAGRSIQMTADWPSNLADGNAQQIMVNGRPVEVTFEKVGDIP